MIGLMEHFQWVHFLLNGVNYSSISLFFRSLFLYLAGIFLASGNFFHPGCDGRQYA